MTSTARAIKRFLEGQTLARHKSGRSPQTAPYWNDSLLQEIVLRPLRLSGASGRERQFGDGPVRCAGVNGRALVSIAIPCYSLSRMAARERWWNSEDGVVTAFRSCGHSGGSVAKAMEKINYCGYRFPPEIIQQAIWLYLRFTLSFRDVEELLAERGITVSYETVRRWVNHFGPAIAADLRKRRPRPDTTWHLDEVYPKIAGRMVYLWRAVDAEGEVLDVLVQTQRNRRSALKLMRKLLKKYGFVPDRMITDDLRSYGAAARDLGIENHHQRGQWKNRVENSHQPTRRRERKMQRSRARAQPRDFSPPMPSSTTPSTSNATLHQPERIASYAPRR